MNSNKANNESESENQIRSYPTPSVLILTPLQPSKDDIYAIAKPYLDAAGLTCMCVYESEEKVEQIERLKQQSKITKNILKFDLKIAINCCQFLLNFSQIFSNKEGYFRPNLNLKFLLKKLFLLNFLLLIFIHYFGLIINH